MELAPCLADRLVCLPPQEERGFLDRRRSGVHDVDAHRLPASLPPVWDAHVHLFPDRLFAALRAWFERHAWPVRYPLNSPEVIDFLLACGVERLVALHYAHKPGISRDLNRYMAELCRDRPEIVGTATVFPGEPESRAILEEAFGLGLRGVKLHCHVQCFAPDEEEVEEVYRACADHRVPLVMHAGREPKSPAYACDPHLLCSADRLEAVLRSYPDLTLVVPHLGADEFDAYAALLERYDNLWLDTTMAVSGYFPGATGAPLVKRRPDRILYGTDFPNLPYSWDRELRVLTRLGLRECELALVLGGNASTLWMRSS